MSYWKKIRILDSWGDDIGSTLTDQMMVAESHRLSGGVFNGSTPDTNFYITNSANVDIYDGLNATGYKIWSSGSMSNQTIPFNIDLDSAGGTAFETGLYLVIN
jgi:hypothetical protein